MQILCHLTMTSSKHVLMNDVATAPNIVCVSLAKIYHCFIFFFGKEKARSHKSVQA